MAQGGYEALGAADDVLAFFFWGGFWMPFGRVGSSAWGARISECKTPTLRRQGPQDSSIPTDLSQPETCQAQAPLSKTLSKTLKPTHPPKIPKAPP